MKGYNKIIVYSPYTSDLQKIELNTNFHKFEIAGKCGNMFYYFKRNNERDDTVNQLVYLNWIDYMFDHDNTVNKLRLYELFNVSYNSIVIEKGCPREIINKLKENFVISDNAEVITTTATFNEIILNELSKLKEIRGNI